ncbi:carbohydrate deacetylase [Paenibacillus sp. 1001270B_150601_E10]|uniref:carbohydrate deacetylase n=1 Tax=Paenibacillus sp. 1001270B_150601_E10 TaxID=2787079 RepID=UPI00189DAF87|nr:ChbG/HpnK family deacetylase [Paenibacillus sp. 1001270B_150601_E10]
MTFYLIINADDFGMSESINHGIITAYRAGAITSTTLMANEAAFMNAVHLSRSFPALGVGLHFNLTSGKALSPPSLIPSLVDSAGSFTMQKHLWRAEHIEVELESQYNRLLAEGLSPTHIDSHHHIHLELDTVYNVVTEFAFRHSLPTRLHPLSKNRLYPPQTTNFIILDTYHEQSDMDKLLRHLSSLRKGTTEIMCHPGPLVRSSAERYESELSVWTHPIVQTALSSPHLSLIHYGHLAAIPQTSTRAASSPSAIGRRQLPRGRQPIRKMIKGSSSARQQRNTKARTRNRGNARRQHQQKAAQRRRLR